MKRIIFIIFVIALLVLAVSCSTELGHSDHDHDGDGVQDHAAEDHVDETLNSEDTEFEEEIEVIPFEE